MAQVSVSELQAHAAELVDRVASGARFTVIRAGEPVAVLLPVGRTPLGVMELRARRRALPSVDPAALRADLDLVSDAEV